MTIDEFNKKWNKEDYFLALEEERELILEYIPDDGVSGGIIATATAENDYIDYGVPCPNKVYKDFEEIADYYLDFWKGKTK